LFTYDYAVQGGKIVTGGSVIDSEGNFVQPTIVEISPSVPVVKEELFGPVLYVMKFQVQINTQPLGTKHQCFDRG
jgi:acyl-CoA reductase-like NAD-dependent aldehyde dehydrogenase